MCNKTKRENPFAYLNSVLLISWSKVTMDSVKNFLMANEFDIDVGKSNKY